MKKFLTLLTLLCLMLSLMGCENNNYKKAVNNYLDVYRRGETEKLEALAPEEVIEKLKETQNFNIKTYGESVTETYNGIQKSLINIYGEDPEFIVKVNSKEDSSKNALNSIRDKINQLYGIPKKDVKKLVVANFTITHKGNGKEKSFDSDIKVVKIKSNWYVCNEYGDFGISNNLLYY